MTRREQRRFWLETLKWTARTTWGLVICATLAVASAYLFSKQSWIIFLPILFVAVLVAVAMRYGVMVGILGSVMCAAIFAHLLFSPLHSLRVADDTARASLAWMVLGGVAIPYLVLPGLRGRSKK